ncbi:hypothetical protein V9L05_22335 (plasmid) [Bernardetia sp. Wsw4-3y2]|uniref:hypothetical protein n=1 Tax=Bernardetia sp. Wsw4-3y2 TaxID=3127471 RepID=UPI0030D5B5B7
MSQNPTINKFSSFIGIALLLSIIAFTVFINFYERQVTEELEAIEFEEEKNQAFTPNELLDFWELEGIRADKIAARTKEQDKTYIVISKTVRSLESDLSKDSLFVYYGSVEFSTMNSGENNKNEELAYFKIIDKNDTQLDLVNQISNLFIDHQIHSISVLPKSNHFTCINFKDSSKVFLIKDNKTIENTYYKEFIKEAKFLNDSTKLYLPKVE